MLIPNKIPILLVSMTVCFVLCMQRVKCGPLTHHVDHKTAEMPELQPSNREVFENTPTYMKELYGLASQDTKRLDLLHDGDSVRSFFDEGKLLYHSEYINKRSHGLLLLIINTSSLVIIKTRLMTSRWSWQKHAGKVFFIHCVHLFLNVCLNVIN